MSRNQLGIFVRVPVAGQVKSRISPTLSPEATCELYRAFLSDLFGRLSQARVSPTVFYSGEPASEIASLLPRPWPMVAQTGDDLGARMSAAFDRLLSRPPGGAVIIGSDSPDLPLVHLRHAFQRLKHRDVVIGPAMDGGYYLIGLRRPAPGVFREIEWGGPDVLMRTIDAVGREGLTLSLLPPWYDVDDARSLELLRSLCAARRRAGGVRLPATERVLLGG